MASNRPFHKRPQVLGARYSEPLRRLEVVLPDGVRYWKDVSVDTWRRFKQADAAGRFPFAELGPGAEGGFVDEWAG